MSDTACDMCLLAFKASFRAEFYNSPGCYILYYILASAVYASINLSRYKSRAISWSSGTCKSSPVTILLVSVESPYTYLNIGLVRPSTPFSNILIIFIDKIIYNNNKYMS